MNWCNILLNALKTEWVKTGDIFHYTRRTKFVMKCDFMGRKRLRYHFHCLSDFVYRYKCHQSSQNVDLEEEFLHAAEFGDIPSVKRILDQTPEMNVDCIDALGRTALRLAVKNEHLEVNKQLMTIWMIYWSKYPTPSLTKKSYSN